ncbi:Zinc finger, CCCH-type [Sesbania bispinosa]|nr:Zinc finger, CCCH-type [Sesbania bispinosa]
MSEELGFEFSINMETEACPFPPSHFKKPKISPTAETPFNHRNLKVKTQLCRRFRQGMCTLGSKCNYAHGMGELRRPSFQEHRPKLCRLFLRNKHCTYGHTCRFLHSTAAESVDSPNNWEDFEIKGYTFRGNSHAQLQQQYRTMQSSAHATIDGNSSAEYRTMQSSTAATHTNALTSTVATSSLHKNELYVVKGIFKENELQRISRIYADWI